VLIVHAEKDAIPVELVREVYDRAELEVLDCKHTELYNKES
jgi:hypothetical protein